MRTFSFFTIVLLCLALLIIDTLTFFWLRSIIQFLFEGWVIKAIYVAFWVFTVGLISAILLLKFQLDQLAPKRKQLLISSLYGLTVSSFLPKIVFVIVISLLYLTNFGFSEKDSIWIVPLAGLFSGFLPFFMVLYAIFMAVHKFKVHAVRVRYKRVPDSFKGLRIVHISDLHLGSFNYRYHILENAVNMINRLRPDLLLFTGDLVNNYAWELRGWNNILARLSANIGKYAVLGNHDYGDYSQWETPQAKADNFESIKNFFHDIGFRLLLNEAEIIKYKNRNLAIVGVENWSAAASGNYANLGRSMAGLEEVSFKILLSHDPSHWPEEVVSFTDIDLTLSGHTHGMQAGIQLGDKKWSPIKYKYPHWAGLYRKNDQYLYVNRGLGWIGFPGRVGMRPEITLIELDN